jgi:hypothetical protein
MSSYSVQTLIAELEGILHGTTSNQIQNLYGVINRAARQVLLDVDPQETKRTAQFVTPIFNSVFDYPIASDVKGNRLIDIKPQVQRIPRDVWTQQYNQAFDLAKQNIYASPNMFTMNFDTGIKTVRINAPFLNAPTVINQMESITSNGTWSVGGFASDLAVNNSNWVQGAASLQFNTKTGTNYLENSTMQAINLSGVQNQSYLFVWVYVPTGTKLTSVTLSWGSSSWNYWTSTVTTNQQNNAFVNGWNQCQFVWSSATTTGTPDASKIKFARVALTTSAYMDGVILNGLQSVLGTILQYEYYSKCMFRDGSTGAFQETVTDNSNLLNLDTESFNLMVYKVAALAVQQQQGLDGTLYDAPYFEAEYQKALARYKSLYKSELQKPQSMYYPMNKPGYGRYLGRWNP